MLPAAMSSSRVNARGAYDSQRTGRARLRRRWKHRVEPCPSGSRASPRGGHRPSRRRQPRPAVGRSSHGSGVGEADHPRAPAPSRGRPHSCGRFTSTSVTSGAASSAQGAAPPSPTAVGDDPEDLVCPPAAVLAPQRGGDPTRVASSRRRDPQPYGIPAARHAPRRHAPAASAPGRGVGGAHAATLPPLGRASARKAEQKRARGPRGLEPGVRRCPGPPGGRVRRQLPPAAALRAWRSPRSSRPEPNGPRATTAGPAEPCSSERPSPRRPPQFGRHDEQPDVRPGPGAS